MRRLIVALVATLLVATMSPAVHASESIWRDLRTQDGLVILYRHAIAPGGGDPPGAMA